jgi:hypothetical protein
MRTGEHTDRINKNRRSAMDSRASLAMTRKRNNVDLRQAKDQRDAAPDIEIINQISEAPTTPDAVAVMRVWS